MASLAEEILALSNPRPAASFHPDEEFLQDETAAKVCDFAYEAEGDRVGSPSSERRARSGRKRRRIELEEDPKYAGRVVSRKELEDGKLSGWGML